MFNSDQAAAAIASRNNIADWAALMARNQTADQLNQLQRDQFAAGVGLGQTALTQAGELKALDKRLDFETEQSALDRRQRRRDFALQSLASLGSAFAGSRIGIDPRFLQGVDVNSVLARANDRNSQLATLFNPNPDYASFLSQIAQGSRGVGVSY